MRLNCGLTRAEKRQLIDDGLDPRQSWHTRFAWLPVRIGRRDCRWLETIERKGVFHYGGYAQDDYWTWEYKSVT